MPRPIANLNRENNDLKTKSRPVLLSYLRATPRNYQLHVEIVKKWPPLKLSQNEALWALVTKSLV